MTEEQSTEHQTVIVLKRKYVIAQLVVFLTLFVLLVALYQYVGYVDRERNRQEREKDKQFCQLFGGIDKQYQKSPPPTESGKVFAEDIHELVRNLHCPSE